MITETLSSPIVNRTHLLRSFISELETESPTALDQDQFERLQTSAEELAPSLFRRQYWAQAATWFLLGVVLTRAMFLP